MKAARMFTFSFLSLFFFALGSPVSAMADNQINHNIVPLPLPKSLRVQSSTPLGQVWQNLTEKEKHLAYYLIQAGREGRTLIFLQTHRHSLELRDVLKKAFSEKNLAKTKTLLGEKAYPEFLTYSAKFLDAAGPYGGSNRKYILKDTTAPEVDKILRAYAPKMDERSRGEIVALLTDPGTEVQQYPESNDGDGLENTGGNLYEKGITGEDIRKAMAAGLTTTLNGRVVRSGKKLVNEMQTVSSPGATGAALKKIVANLTKAKKYATTKFQRQELDAMIKYLDHGNVNDFRAANIDWVRDRSHSPVDFMLSWVEVYDDFLAHIGSWESYVQVVDPKVSLTAESLARHAQAFEDNMPYEAKYKKTFPKDYSPPAIMVYYFQEISSFRSGGYNLPNFDDIRRDVGAKNVIRLPLPGEDKDPDIRALYEEYFNEFLPADKVAPILAEREKIWQNIVLMHEIIGHGSGTYNTSKYPNQVDPISALGSLGSALEEQRADLAALTFMNDPILIQIGIYKDASEAKKIRDLSYDFYLADFLRRTSGNRTFTEAHQRGHWLFVNRLMKAGAVAWASKDGKQAPTTENQVLVVKDYDGFQKVAREVLGQLQDIKAERKQDDLKKLFDQDAPLDAINTPWAQAIIARGESLKINSGYVEQPWRVTPSLKFETEGGKTLESVAPYWSEYY